MTELKKWTLPQYYIGASWPDYYVGLRQCRDSDALDRSNFRSFLAAIGGESETVHIVRESHWAVGWIEWVAIHESDTKALDCAREIMDALDNYPVVDESDWSELEWEDAANYWDGLTPRARVELALDVRARYHWLQDEPVWPLGRLDYGEMVNRDTEITRALEESLRSN